MVKSKTVTLNKSLHLTAVAIVMRKLGLDYAEAKKRLDANGGFVRKVLQQ